MRAYQKNHFDWMSLGGVPGGLSLVSIIIILEHAMVSLGDLFGIMGKSVGIMLYIPIHFFFNPILCLAYIIITIIKAIIIRKVIIIFPYLFFVGLAFIYLYFVVTGDLRWMDIMGIDFN